MLAERPTGVVDDSTTRLETEETPELADGEALVAVRYLSIDPTIRTWMNDAPGYLPPIGVGEVIRSGGLGEVVESKSDRYAVGDSVFGLVGWQEYAVADEGARAMQVIPAQVPPTLALNILGLTGVTAYFGMLDVGGVKEGDVVVVSGAAGATGSVAGQIARIKGAAKVVGIAGGPEKCAWLTGELGFDAAIDYKNEDVAARLAEEAPAIDLYFDNVGGTILEAALANLALRGRIVICGAISQYNAAGGRAAAQGPANYTMLVIRRGRMEGFLVLDYAERFGEAQAQLGAWVAEGRIKGAEHIVEGLENAPAALNLLFTGGNTGKVMVRL
ncbi:MAG TPA: NADP-dependent oxidoreductase [Solirubrobacteraceae bacterium]|nr:NADP-dependent oxidoreductase [Solirubrobacteraceae bacterium]